MKQQSKTLRENLLVAPTQFVRSIFVLFLFLIALPHTQLSALPDAPVWSKIVIKEAFISRETHEANRDTFSAPEFGWTIPITPFRTDLYGTLYAPVPPGEDIQMRLVERDVFADDIVYTFTAKANDTKISLGTKDFVEIERTAFFPDGKSGADAAPSGAQTLGTRPMQDSVSFQDGDYTDYFKTEKGESVVILDQFIFGAIVDDSDGNIFPDTNKINKSLYAIKLRDSGLVRVRSSVGGSKSDYKIRAFYGSNRNLAARDYFVSTLKDANFVKYQDARDALLFIDSAMLQNMCKIDRSILEEKVLCAYLIYDQGTPEQIKKLEAKYPRESEKYKSAVSVPRNSYLNREKDT